MTVNEAKGHRDHYSYSLLKQVRPKNENTYLIAMFSLKLIFKLFIHLNLTLD